MDLRDQGRCIGHPVQRMGDVDNGLPHTNNTRLFESG